MKEKGSESGKREKREDNKRMLLCPAGCEDSGPAQKVSY